MGMAEADAVRDITKSMNIAGTQEGPMAHSLNSLEEVPYDAPVPGVSLRVLIAEREGLVRAGLRALLERQEGIAVVAEAAAGDDAVAEAVRLRPDVVVMAAALPELDGIEATRRIMAAVDAGETDVLMLMDGAGDDGVFAALRAGATGLLLRDVDADALVAAVRVVGRGETLLAPALASRVVSDFLSRPERLHSSPEELDELTAREREVVALVACGLSNDEIAERLVVTRATAKTHVSRALCKLHARDRAQLVVLAYESGLVRPGPRWSDGALDAVARIPRIAGAAAPPRLRRVAA
jgi:DNA-binding NarL/FixJ family response regulator